MPFGLENAPAPYQRVMKAVLARYLPFAKCHIADILVYSPDMETHLEHLDTVLTGFHDVNEHEGESEKVQFRTRRSQIPGSHCHPGRRQA